jgi:hypothetical protein
MDPKIIRNWAEHPNRWVWDIFGDGFRPTVQQKKAWDELGKLVRAKMKVRDGLPLTEEEKRYASKYGISIMSGNGTGKDAWSSITLLWFLSCFPEAYGLATANSAKQLRNVLWREINKWMRNSKKPSQTQKETILEQLFEWQAEKVFWKEYKGKEWFVEAVTINTNASEDEQAEAIAGRHERHMIIIVDEASGIAQSVFNKLEATMTSPVNIMLLIFNPTRSKGYAVESQNSEHWIGIRWNAEEVVSEGRTDLITEEHIQRLEDKYGRDSNPFRIRVLGLPPLADSDTLIPYDWIMDAVGRQFEILENMPLIKGVDVGAGGDKSVILTRKGPIVTKITRLNTADTMVLVSRVTAEAAEDEPQAICVDNIGIGQGVYDRLLQTSRNVFAVDVRRTPRNAERFNKMRDELWWKTREAFENGIISIPDDKDLTDQLSIMRYDVETGKIKVESKKQLKIRGENSPDEADALCLTYYLPDHSVAKKIEDRYNKPKRIEYSWMGR